MKFTKEEISASWSDAEQKVRDIISREGDADGERRKDWYFFEILKEIILTKRETAEIRKGAMHHV